MYAVAGMAGAWQAPPAAQLVCPAPAKEGKKADAEQKKVAALLKRLQAFEKKPNEGDAKGQTLLMAAAAANQRLLVCYLIARGADVDVADKEGKTAIDYARSSALRELIGACRSATGEPALFAEERQRRAELMGMGDAESRRTRIWQLAGKPGSLKSIVDLIRHDTEVDGTNAEGVALLQVPKLSPEYAAYFVRNGYDLSTKGKDGSGLITARTTAPTARLLLALGWQPEETDASSLLLAALFADDTAEVKRLLKEHPELLSPGKDAFPLLGLALSGRMVHTLHDAGAPPPVTGLLDLLIAESAENPRNASVVKALLDIGAACKKNILLSLCARGSADVEIARLFLATGEVVGADDFGTALHHAAARGCTAMVKLLLAHEMNPNTTNKHGDTPLLCVLKSPDKASAADQVDTVKALIKGGANPKIKDQEGLSPLQIAKAAGRDDLVKALKSSSK